jgi:betaine-aldehyde dehydrogenase
MAAAAAAPSYARASANFRDALYINGSWVKPAGTFEVVSGATGAVLASSPQATAEHVEAAAAGAAAAFKTWSRVAPAERAGWLRKLADELERRKDDVASVEAAHTSKPFREAQGDVDDACAAFRYCATHADALGAGTLFATAPTGMPAAEFAGSSIRYESVGVVGAICPFNFPLMMAAWKVGPSLAAGCTIIVKPSEFTPFSALCLAECAHAIGLPAGVLSVLPGYGDVGAALVQHRLVDKVTFTGSVATGAKVASAAGAALKRCTLELGGKSPALVFEDADIEGALEWLFFGFAWNCGQICSATSRLIVHKSVEEKVVARLAAAAGRVKAGGPFDEGVELGPIGNKMQYDKVVKYIELSRKEGLDCACGGSAPHGLDDKYAGGFFVAPTIFTGVTPKNTIFKEEVFGPVLAVSSFETEAEAVALANDSEFGLAAAVFTTDAARAQRVAGELRAGVVWVNNAQPSPHAQPWGGFKKSGIGREMGPYALLPFLEQKAVTNWVHAKGESGLGWYAGSHFTA